jgi:hypothetical protein
MAIIRRLAALTGYCRRSDNTGAVLKRAPALAASERLCLGALKRPYFILPDARIPAFCPTSVSTVELLLSSTAIYLPRRYFHRLAILMHQLSQARQAHTSWKLYFVIEI